MSLDIPDRQVLIYYDQDRIPWHHRVLLCRVAGSQWVVCTPDREVQVENLGDHTSRTLRRGAPFPQDCTPVYSFEPITDEEMQQMRNEPRQLAEVLGVTTDALQELDVDPELELFSKEVESRYLHHANAVTRGEMAIVPQPGAEDEYTVAQRIPAKDLGKWMEGKRSGAGGDARLCPSRDGFDGTRRATLSQSLADYKEVKMVGWPRLFKD
eukprot:6479897-Amphidinium_carterae.1